MTVFMFYFRGKGLQSKLLSPDQVFTPRAFHQRFCWDYNEELLILLSNKFKYIMAYTSTRIMACDLHFKTRLFFLTRFNLI